MLLKTSMIMKKLLLILTSGYFFDLNYFFMNKKYFYKNIIVKPKLGNAIDQVFLSDNKICKIILNEAQVIYKNNLLIKINKCKMILLI